MSHRFSSPTYVVRRKVFTLAGGAFHIYDGQGQLVLYSKLKAFKLKEDLRLFTGEDMREELLAIHARKVLDISATYDVTDSVTGAVTGFLTGARPVDTTKVVCSGAPGSTVGPLCGPRWQVDCVP